MFFHICDLQSMRLKLIANNTTVERRFSAWIGGSILASLVRAHRRVICLVLTAVVIMGAKLIPKELFLALWYIIFTFRQLYSSHKGNLVSQPSSLGRDKHKHSLDHHIYIHVSDNRSADKPKSNGKCSALQVYHQRCNNK